MQVETFECYETAAEPIEATEEAVALIEQLGLHGQLELVRPKSDEGVHATRCPYREMTAEEIFVYGVLCPDQAKLHQYKAGPIPLRVLQVAAHAQSLGMFSHLEVWDRASVTVKDPVLVGCIMDRTYSWMVGKRFILARWGEVLETFSVLRTRALGSHKETLIQQAKSLLSRVENATDAELMGKTEISW